MNLAGILSALLTTEVLLCLVLGTVAGIVIGALPGLSASMGVALMIPITFDLSPVAGLVMLTAVYTSAIYGGSITACLLHTPGTPSSAATAIDGYQLTRQGKGMKAIGVSTVSSMIGGIVSAVALLLIAPPLAGISLKFSAPEYMFMALFGMTIIGSLAGESMAKGLLAGAFGVFLGIVGLDPMVGIPRYIFGSIHLENGITLIPAMIGMFSISQVMIASEDIFKKKTSILSDPTKALDGQILPTLGEFRQILPAIVRSSVIGVLVGILPGAGGDIGSWVAYNEAKRFSKRRDSFGKGSIEGIAASESANNAVTGGALIPLLTLGIPGSGTAAILLGGLMIHGMNPGYDLFTKQGNTTYAIIIGFLLANILMGLIGLLVAKHVAKVSMVPMTILCPIIIALATVGAYAINNSMFDVYTMAFFGLVGYFMRKADFGAAPMVLGLILSRMVELNYRRCLVLCRGNMLSYLFARPISVVLMALVVLGLFSPFVMKRINNRMRQSIAEDDPS